MPHVAGVKSFILYTIMKTLFTTVTNTIKAVKLLSNPAFAQLLEKEIQGKLYSKEAFYHKHYVVQVVN